MKRLFQILFLSIVLQLFAPPVSGLPEGVDEYLLKAAFFERFTRFVDYGGNSGVTDKPFVVTILGENPFGKRLDQIYSDQRILNRKVKLIYTGDLAKIGEPDILYIGPDKRKELKEVLAQVEGRQVITIADSPVFSKSGVMINLLLVNDKIRFEIDLEAANKQKIKFDRILLANAIIVGR